MPDRLCLQGILYVLYNDVSWQLLPPELGFGSGQTCWRRLGRWHEAGVFDVLHRSLLARPNAADAIDWSRACADASYIRAKKGAKRPARPRSTGGKTGSKHHLICDGNGTPFKVITTGANVNDVTQALALVDGIPLVTGPIGHPRRRPEALLGDKGYDSNPNRKELRQRGILPVISRKGQSASRGLSKLRYVVEQTFACSTNSSAWPSAGSAASTSTMRSSRWRVPSSAGGGIRDWRIWTLLSSLFVDQRSPRRHPVWTR